MAKRGRRTKRTAIDRYRAKNISSKVAQRAASAALNEIGKPPKLHHSRKKIRKQCDARLERFLFECFPEAWYLEPGELHHELIQECENIIRFGGKAVIAEPRGTGKTAIVARAALWGMLRGPRKRERWSRYICLIAANEQKKSELIGIIKAELLKPDSRLSELYPVELHGLRHIAQASAPQITAKLLTCQGEKVHALWNSDRVRLPLIPGSVCGNSVISACTLSGGDIRGQIETHHGLGREIRPGTVVIDDGQTKQSSKSPPETDTRESTIIQDVAGMVGPGESLAMFQTVTVMRPFDLAERFLDPRRNTDWRKIRRQLMPKDVPTEDGQRLWETYLGIFLDTSRSPENRQQLCTAFYELHREQMDEGLHVTWPARHEPWQASGIQFAMHTKLTTPEFYQTEMQNEPTVESSEETCRVTVEQVQQKPNGRGRYRIPRETAHVATGVDVHGDVLYFLTVAASQDFSVLQIADYGTYPDQKVPYFVKRSAPYQLKASLGVTTEEAAIFQGLQSLLPHLLELKFHTEHEVGIKSQLIGIDVGYRSKIVHNVIAGLGEGEVDRVIKYKGQGIDAKAQQIEHFHKSNANRGLWWSQMFALHSPMNVDTNAVKEFATRRLAIERGATGSLELFGKPNEHRMLAEQLADSEMATLSLAKRPGKDRLDAKWVFEHVVGRDNHFLDCLVIALACLNRVGCAPLELAPKTEPKPETDWAAQALEEARKAGKGHLHGRRTPRELAPTDIHF